MAEKRKISCPAATGTGERKKYKSYSNYNSYDEKKQEGREILYDIFILLLKAVVFLINCIAGVIFVFSLSVAKIESMKAAAMMFVIPGAWLIAYGLIHDWLIDREKGGAER